MNVSHCVAVLVGDKGLDSFYEMADSLYDIQK